MTVEPLLGLPWLVYLLGGSLLGYALGRVHAYRAAAAQDRERAVSALAGTQPLPDWEIRARKLEEKAYRRSMGWLGDSYDKERDVQQLRSHADHERARGQQRDEVWGKR